MSEEKQTLTDKQISDLLSDIFIDDYGDITDYDKAIARKIEQYYKELK